MDEIFKLLASRCDDEGYTRVDDLDLSKWSTDLKLSSSDFLNQIGLEIAKRYHAKELSFEFCNSLINYLWGDMLELTLEEKSFQWPSVFHDVYEAFDAGEFRRSSDKTDDPITEFTNPEIASIVERGA